MQSPAIIAGLRRIATSLWLRFVALPQRAPVFDHRPRGRPVVNVIDRVAPPSSIAAQPTRSRGSKLSRASGRATRCPRNRIASPMSCPGAPTHTSTLSRYAEPERVAKLRRPAGAGNRAPRGELRPADRLSELRPNVPATVRMARRVRGIVPRADVATGRRSRFRHR